MVAPARRAAFRVLRAVNAGANDLPAALADARARLADPRDQALVAELATGTLRWQGALDHVIAQSVSRPLARLDPPVLDAMRLGAYQLLYLDRVPPPAVIDDAVQIVKDVRLRSAAGLVNAVLRSIDRNRTRLEWPPDPGPAGALDAQVDHVSVALSHPRWLVERWLARHGYAAARSMAWFNNSPAPLTLRVNTLRTTGDALRSRLSAEGILVEPGHLAPDCLIVRADASLAVPLAASGAFIFQDEASQLVATLAAAAAGPRVLDVCAAPGGKTVGLAAATRDTGLIVGMDLRPRRVDLLRRTVAVSGATSIRVVRADALQPLPFGATFDLVLVDAPCSGLGTIRRDPEIRWRRSVSDLPGLAATQRQLLARAAEAVRPGGRLVYATCSSEPEENEEVVDRFLADDRRFAVVDPRAACPRLSPSVAQALDADGRLRTTPWRHRLECFFAAMLVKQKHL